LENVALSDRANSSTKIFKPSWVAVLFVYLVFAAVMARTLAVEEMRPLLPGYLGLELIYLILFTLALWKSNLSGWVLHLYFVLQSILVLWMISFRPQFDFVILLFALLTFQAALFFRGWMRWIWVGLLVFLTAGSLIFYLGLLHGLALSLTTIAGEIVLTSYLIASQEIAQSQCKSQELLGELQETHQQLKRYADQVEELASVQERNRLARELHDSVSQLIFSISLTARSAQLLLEKEPARVPELLKRLQEMTSDALSQLRAFITQLHPPQKS
jgi:signal transduction histidine kinase